MNFQGNQDQPIDWSQFNLPDYDFAIPPFSAADYSLSMTEYAFDPLSLALMPSINPQQTFVNPQFDIPLLEQSRASPKPSSTEEGKDKKTRSAYASSCASCRFRKVRCIRSDPSEPCKSCLKKGIQCTEVDSSQKPKPKRKYKERTGDRIELAKDVFGTTAQGENHSSPDSNSSPSSLSLSSVASKMDDAQISAAFCSSLVDSYYSCSYFQQPCVDWTELRYRFAAVGYRPNELEIPTQALLSVIVAIAARVAPHEGIIGPCDISNMSILPLKPNVDLSVYGEKRNRICTVLIKEAQKKLSDAGLMLKPSAETIAAYYLLGSLQILTDRDAQAEGRLYGGIAVSHLRQLHEDEKDNNIVNRIFFGGVNYTMCASDAMYAVRAGRSLQLTEEDLQLFLREAHHKYDDLTEECLMAFINKPSRAGCFKNTQPMWNQFVSISRSLVANLCGPYPSKMPFNVEALYDFWKKYDSLWAWTTLARQALRGRTRENSFFAMIAQHCEMARCCLMEVNLSSYNALRKRIARGVVSMEEAATLHDLQAMAHKRVEDSAISMAEHIELLISTSSNITLASSIQVLQNDLQDWTSFLKSAPTAMEGGDPAFTMERKIQLVEVCIVAHKALSYSWPGFKQQISALSAYLNDLKDNQAYSQLSLVA